jgi:hypothetical protein
MKFQIALAASTLSLLVAWSGQASAEVAMYAATSSYSCEEASRIKFSQAEYEALPIQNRIDIDQRYMNCQLEKEAPDGQPEQQAVVITDQVDGKPRVFYGLVATSDLKKGYEACLAGGAIATIGLTVTAGLAGDGAAMDAGQFAMGHVDVACSAVANAFANNDLMLVFSGADNIAAAAVAQASLIETLDVLGVSDADLENIKKLTTPPSVSIDDGRLEVKVGPIDLKTNIW